MLYIVITVFVYILDIYLPFKYSIFFDIFYAIIYLLNASLTPLCATPSLVIKSLEFPAVCLHMCVRAYLCS